MNVQYMHMCIIYICVSIHECMYTYMYTCSYEDMHQCIYTDKHKCLNQSCMSLNVSLYVCMYVTRYARVYACVWMYMCTHIYEYVYIHECMNAYIYAYIHKCMNACICCICMYTFRYDSSQTYDCMHIYVCMYECTYACMCTKSLLSCQCTHIWCVNEKKYGCHIANMTTPLLYYMAIQTQNFCILVTNQNQMWYLLSLLLPYMIQKQRSLNMPLIQISSHAHMT